MALYYVRNGRSMPPLPPVRRPVHYSAAAGETISISEAVDVVRPPGWSLLGTTGSPPSARYFTNVCYCPPLSGTVIFSGSTDAATALDNSVYLLSDDGAWSTLSTTGAPAGRWGGGMYYSSGDGLIHLIGGYDSTAGHTFFNTGEAAHVTLNPNTLVWDLVTQSGTPLPGVFATAAYGAAVDRGFWWPGQQVDTHNTNQPYSLGGTTWHQLSTSSSPSRRQRFGITFDEDREVFVMYGGIDGSTINAETWETPGVDSGSTWEYTGATAGDVGIREGIQIAWSPLYGTLLFGGGNDTDALAGTAFYDGTTWTQPTLAIEPPARLFGSMVWSSGMSKFVLIGGNTVAGLTTDVWTYGAA